ncbi:cobyric acid synthase [Salinithrix halophila]|uniref:Cobyric acid synthase n=2 Tax=Salinithrix halophila TaxID=1485204 RepID=A0ABV8JEN0_9BACL
MFQGTSSDVGKSVLATAFCRLFADKGYRVAPFKAQNMALNSYVTVDGGEIGRSQGVQAEAAGVEAETDMNPILLKPKGDRIAEVIVHGRHYADMQAGEYQARTRGEMLEPVRASLARLKQRYDLLVIEGAGSPAEVNLREREIVNMQTAKLADVPVILVADIDRGGVFASIVGTLDILEPDERARVQGLIINKFRGDLNLLRPGLDWLEERTGIPVLGVLPFREIAIDPEDSLALGGLDKKGPEAEVEIAVIRLPRISNFTDFLPLSRVPGACLRYVGKLEEWGNPDAVILPGTKNTMEDFRWLRETGLAERVALYHQEGGPVAGICGGYQMMARRLTDPEGVESTIPEVEGLGLLPVDLSFRPGKRTVRAEGEVCADGWASGVRVKGYEIHLGRASFLKGHQPFLRLADGKPEGAVERDGEVWGTHLHGIFDNTPFLFHWINHLRRRKGLHPLEEQAMRGRSRSEIYADLAVWVGEHLDMERIDGMMGWER